MEKPDVDISVVDPAVMQRGMQFQQIPQQIPQQMPVNIPIQGEGIPVMPMQAVQPQYDSMMTPPPPGMIPPTSIPMNKRRRGTLLLIMIIS